MAGKGDCPRDLGGRGDGDKRKSFSPSSASPSPNLGRGSPSPSSASPSPNLGRGSPSPSSASPSPTHVRGFGSASLPHGRGSPDQVLPYMERRRRRELESQFSAPQSRYNLQIGTTSSRTSHPKPTTQLDPQMLFADAVQKPKENPYPSLLESMSIAAPGTNRGSPKPTPTDDYGIPKDFLSPGDADYALKKKFLNLLNSSGPAGIGYRAMAESQSRIGLEVLTVKFEDMLTEQYIDLAMEVIRRCKHSPEHGWLQPCASVFLNAHFKYATTAEQRRLHFRFTRAPTSIKPLSQFRTQDVVEKKQIFHGRYTVLRTTREGRLVYLSVLNYALGLHKNLRSHNGGFGNKDVYILQYEGKGRFRCIILAAIISIGQHNVNPRVNDLQRINIILTPRYCIAGEYPAYFPYLQRALSGLTALILTETCILRILPCHYSLMSPAAWGFFMSKVQLAIQRAKASGANFSQLFGDKVPGYADWRPFFRRSLDAVVRGVYGYKNNDAVDKFSNDLGGMCDNQRHLVMHAHHHPSDDPVRVSSPDDSELFAALKMPTTLPETVEGLFAGSEMLYEEELGPAYMDFCKFCYTVDEEHDYWQWEEEELPYFGY